MIAPPAGDAAFPPPLPPGWTWAEDPPRRSACRSCDALIYWAITPRGKRAPIEDDGTQHFASCPDARDWRKPR